MTDFKHLLITGGSSFTSNIKNSRISGPVSLTVGVVIEDSYVGPYTRLGENVRVISSEVEHSILIDGSSLKHLSQRMDLSILGHRAWAMKGTSQ